MIAHVVIPSKSRAGKMVCMKSLVPKLSKELFEVSICVEPQDEEIYRLYYPDTKIFVLPENNRGIGYSRSKIQEHFGKDSSLVMFDDDLGCLRVRDGLTAGGFSHLAPCDPNEAFCKAVEAADVHGLAGFPPSFTAWKMPDGEMFGRIWNFCCLSPKLFSAGVKYDSDLMLFEDFDFQAQALSKGFQTVLLSHWSFETGERIGTREGGCQSFDRVALSLTMSHKMVERWGEKVRLKPNKKSGNIEPVFLWKKFIKLPTEESLQIQTEEV